MNEDCAEKFVKNEQLFITYWNDQEPKFIEYYQLQYSKMAGKSVHTLEFLYVTFSPNTKAMWAMCYRHFDHHNCDTNILVER